MTQAERDDYDEKVWKLQNLYVDTMLKTAQRDALRLEPWKLVVSAIGAAGALLAAGGAFVAVLFHFSGAR